MKKGIIIEMKGKQKVILADNGRFYIVPVKEGDFVGGSAAFSSYKNKIISLVLVFVITLSAIYGGVFVVTTANSNIAETLVQVEVNPSVEFLLNGKGTVLSAAPLNETAAMLITGENFKGMKIEEAVNLFIKLAIKCGYIDLDNEFNAVYLCCLNDNAGKTDNLYNSVREGLDNFLNENTVKAVVLKEISSPGIAALATMYNCDISRFKTSYTVYKILKYGGDQRDFNTVMNDLKGRPAKELLNVIRQAHVVYGQKLSAGQRQKYLDIKQLKINLNSAVIENYLNSPQYKAAYAEWVLNKQYYAVKAQNYEININEPRYLSLAG